MADGRLRVLERRAQTEPTTDALAALLAERQRLGITKLSKQNINLMATLGIEPVVLACLGGSAVPAEMVVPSFRCISGLRGCWNSFPHHHDQPRPGGRVMDRTAPPKSSVAKRIAADVGWDNLSDPQDIGWLGQRIYKAGWRPSIIALHAVFQAIPWSCEDGPGTEWAIVRDVEHCLRAANLIALRRGSSTEVEALKMRALGIIRDEMPQAGVDVNRMLLHPEGRVSFAAHACLALAKQHMPPDSLRLLVQSWQEQGRPVPKHWLKAMSHPHRRGNRNKHFGAKPLHRLLPMLCYRNIASMELLHRAMQRAMFHGITGLSLAPA